MDTFLKRNNSIVECHLQRVRVFWLTLKCTRLPSFHLLLGLDLHGFEYVSSLQHNVVAHFNSVLRFFVAAIRHVQTGKPAVQFAKSNLSTLEVFVEGFFRDTQIYLQKRRH